MKKLLLIALFLLAGCSPRPSLPYPDAYTQAKLPEYNKAWVTNNGNVDASPEEGVAIKLRSRESVKAIRSYYEEMLLSHGWEGSEEPPENSDIFYIRSFEKNNETIQLLIEDQGDDNQSISIIYQKTTEE